MKVKDWTERKKLKNIITKIVIILFKKMGIYTYVCQRRHIQYIDQHQHNMYF